MLADRFSVVCHFRNDLSRLKGECRSRGHTGRPPSQTQRAHHIGNVKDKGYPLLKIASADGATGSTSTNGLSRSIYSDGSAGSASANGLIGSVSDNGSFGSTPIRVGIHLVPFESKKKILFVILLLFTHLHVSIFDKKKSHTKSKLIVYLITVILLKYFLKVN